MNPGFLAAGARATVAAVTVITLLAPVAAFAQDAPSDPPPAAVAPAPAAPASDDPASAKGAPPPAAASPAPTTATDPGAPTSTPAAPGEPPANVTANAGAAYAVHLHDLERKTDELKEQVYRSKARLNLLKEMVLHQGSSVGRAVISHRNEMGSTYSLVKLVYAMDGAEIFAKSDDSGKLGDTKEFEIFNGALVPGNHTLSVLMIYRGNGYGVFSYLKGYQFTVKSSHTFAAAEAKQTQLKVVGFEKGNPITTDPKDRPAVDFRMNIVADKPSTPDAGKPPEPAASAPAASDAAAPAPR